MLLNEFISNDTVKDELSEIMSNNSVPHAIIIEGAKGTGRKTLAMIIAQYCVCSSDNQRPCGICPDCKKAEQEIHPDISVFDGNNSGAYSIDSIRNIRSSAFIKPNEAHTKVYILLNCDKMQSPAQNAFLKVLEEPPENVVFIMTVMSATSLLQTVRSRSRIFSLFPVGISEAVSEISKRFPDKNPDEIKHIVSICDGNIGMSLQMLENGGEEAQKLAEDIFRAIPLTAEYQLLLLTSKLADNRNFASSVLDCMLEIGAECVKASVGAKTLSETALEVAKKLPKKRIFNIMENISKARNILNTNVNLNFFSTWLCSVLRN